MDQRGARPHGDAGERARRLPAAHAKGADDLPDEITEGLDEPRVHALDRVELLRVLRAATDGLLHELDASDAALAGALPEPLREMADTS